MKKKRRNSLRDTKQVFSNANGAPVSAPAQVAPAKIVISSKDDIPAELPTDVVAELRRWIGAKVGANKDTKPSQPLEFDRVEDLINVCRERIQKRAEKRAQAAQQDTPKRGPGRPRKSEATATDQPKRKPEAENERDKVLSELNITLADVAKLFDIDSDNLTAFVESELKKLRILRKK